MVYVELFVQVAMLVGFIVQAFMIEKQKKTISQLSSELVNIFNDNRRLKNDLARMENELAKAQKNDARDPNTGRYTGGKK